MAKCQVPECYNRRDKDKGKKSFFRIPDPAKGYRELAQRWLNNIGSGRRVEGFVFSKNKLVCEDHFEVSCFREDLQAQVLGYRPARKKLKPGSVPTIFKSCQDGRRDPKRLWPSQHLSVRKNVRHAKRLSGSKVDPAPSSAVPSSSDSVHGQKDEQTDSPQVHQPEVPLPVPTSTRSLQDNTREESVRQEPAHVPVISNAESFPENLQLNQENHLKVQLVEFADKEIQTDPVLVLPIKRWNCWHGNKVS